VFCFSDRHQGVRAMLASRHRVQNSVSVLFHDLLRSDSGAAQQIPHETQGSQAFLPDDGGGRPQGR
jgi:hypothetical protein